MRRAFQVAVLAGVGALGVACATSVAPVDDGTGGGGGGGTDAGSTARDGGGNLPGKTDGGCSATTCNGKCVDLKTDLANCGACGTACPSGATCTAGACKCTTGQLCNGKCIDTQTDVNNCGSCGNACTGGTGSWSCQAGQCKLGCTGNETACGTECADLTSSDTHCGSCNNDCTGSGASCCASKCANLMTDGNNCGACGTSCNGGACTNGKCCSKPPTGKCLGSPCSPSFLPLAPGCDGKGCVTAVCANDSFCCSVEWDSFCVQEVDTYCKNLGYTCSC